MGKRLQSLLIGHLTIDENQTESGPYIGTGGSVYFAGKTLKDLGAGVTILSPYGSDLEKDSLSGMALYPREPQVALTLKFANIYRGEEKRIQKARNIPETSITNIADFKKLTQTPYDIVLVAPLLPNIQVSEIREIADKFPNSLRVLLPQGYFRQIAPNGEVFQSDWNSALEIVNNFHLIVTSVEDAKNMDREAANWAKTGPTVVVTKGSLGCTVYTKDLVFDSSAFPISPIVDSTGAGDIFAAAYAYQFILSKNEKEAAMFANATASLSLRMKPNELQLDESLIRTHMRTRPENK